jgi:hypothetical protein
MLVWFAFHWGGSHLAQAAPLRYGAPAPSVAARVLMNRS